MTRTELDIEGSIDCILASTSPFATGFYAKFLDEHPEARPFFAETNLDHQALLLTMQLQVVADYYQNRRPVTRLFLQLLGRKHRALEIPDHLFPRFADLLVASLAQAPGDQWTASLERAWREALTLAIATMEESPRPEPETGE